MAVDSSLLQVLNSLSIGDKKAMTIGTSTSAITSSKEFDVIGSLSLNSAKIIRRLPIDFNVHKKLDEWKEKAGVVFYRFLQDKPFFFSFTGIIPLIFFYLWNALKA